ncbi:MULTISPECIES: amino acid ABC transporter permease [Acinetobacter]|uniref:Amino acid ABC transporter permease n=1 Tax=Acinetobacter pollinis TaxID=2605270 RepID=A0ABU6DU47_9GAMM|nr:MULTISPECIES: amino acid ABC transporter permease [Acinetobacter]MBF7689525.1 amino acid ABC transporter permease [Acinetobacter pollinis]MBF7698096.1 amino acid ABC transporter permease [Acinetobacter pollinis]MEB5477387.1 amino acid ABC transporter permease [Acinetobacter pollinis]WEV49747.1 amino acid ABC transporter permease [Acinetobacter sp. ESL0695]
MSFGSLNWTSFCLPSNEYGLDKSQWAESVCKAIGGQSYSPAADAPTWLQMLGHGVFTMVWTACAAFVIAFFLGSLFGILRTVPHKGLAAIGNVYVEVFRNIPLIVQLFFWAFVFPEFLPHSLSDGSGEVVAGGWWKNLLNTQPAIIGVFALGLYTAARVSEHIRAGILTVSRGQKFAASALGFTVWQSYRYVVLPVAYRTVWPTITSEAMNVFKNSAVLYALSVMNFFAYSKVMREETSQDIVILVLSTPVYLIVTYAIKLIMVWIERRMAVPGLGSGGK